MANVVLSKTQSSQLDAVIKRRGKSPIKRQELLSLSEELFGGQGNLAWVAQNADKIGWGEYSIESLIDDSQISYSVVESVDEHETEESMVQMARGKVKVDAVPDVRVDTNSEYVPSIDRNYVTHNNMKTIEPIIASGLFYPVFITGLSGNGKTTMVQQACAKLKRELYRANITIETDEDDLLGGFRLINGDTVWEDGAVVSAMKRGAVLLLDEVDLASNKIMCLQSVLEGKSIYLKKINQIIEPAKGFTVIATANTKGKGDASGSFIGTNVLNEAFLDRFPITVYQDYPTEKQEIKIIDKYRESIGATGDEDFSGKLVTWAKSIRDGYEQGSVSEIITTRRLINIAQAQHIFKDRKKSIQLCIERFDDETKKSFIDFYSALDDCEDDTRQQQKQTAADVLKW